MKSVSKHLVKSSKTCKGTGGRGQLTDASEEEEKEDKSILRPPLNIGIRGVGDLIKAVSSGTPEVQQLLLRECDIVYECKICRSLFRSLANFISHKRLYCTQSYNHFSQRFAGVQAAATLVVESTENGNESDAVVVVEPTEPTEPPALSPDSALNDAPDSDESESVQDNLPLPSREVGKQVRDIAERLAARGGRMTVATSDDVPASVLYTAAAAAQQEVDTSESVAAVLVTESIDKSSQCVFQTVEPAEKSQEPPQPEQELPQQEQEPEDKEPNDFEPNTMRTQVMELDRIESKTQGVLQENGVFKVTPEGTDIASTEVEKHVCKMCDARFMTVQTLLRHVAMHHKERLCYPCPLCRALFHRPWGVYRHLSNLHHKTEEQIRRLRPQILSKAVKRKLTEDKEERGRMDGVGDKERERENEKWMKSYEGDLRCGGCGKLFNRRVVLNVHAANCKERAEREKGSKKQTLASQQTQAVPKIITIQVRKDYNKTMTKTIDQVVEKLQTLKADTTEAVKEKHSKEEEKKKEVKQENADEANADTKKDEKQEKRPEERKRRRKAGTWEEAATDLVPMFSCSADFSQVVDLFCDDLRVIAPRAAYVKTPFSGFDGVDRAPLDRMHELLQTVETTIYCCARAPPIAHFKDFSRPLSPPYMDIPDEGFDETETVWSNVNGNESGTEDMAYTNTTEEPIRDLNEEPAEKSEGCDATERPTDVATCPLVPTHCDTDSHVDKTPLLNQAHGQAILRLNGLSRRVETDNRSLVDHSYLNRAHNKKLEYNLRKCLSRSRCRSVKRAVKQLKNVRSVKSVTKSSHAVSAKLYR